MEEYIALIWNNNNVYDRHCYCSNNEDKESFIKRIHNNYDKHFYTIKVYILGKQVY